MKKICLGAGHVSVGDLSVAIVSACQAISMLKGLAEGAEDGVRGKLCELVGIGPYSGEYQGSANLHEPEGAHEICLIKVSRDTFHFP